MIGRIALGSGAARLRWQAEVAVRLAARGHRFACRDADAAPRPWGLGWLLAVERRIYGIQASLFDLWDDGPQRAGPPSDLLIEILFDGSSTSMDFGRRSWRVDIRPNPASTVSTP